MNLNEMSNRAHMNSLSKGFWDRETEAQACLDDALSSSGNRLLAEAVLAYAVPVRLALIHSETSEILENHRNPNGTRANEVEELADAIIRIGDLAGYRGIDLDAAVHDKMLSNERRRHMHGKLY